MINITIHEFISEYKKMTDEIINQKNTSDKILRVLLEISRDLKRQLMK